MNVNEIITNRIIDGLKAGNIPWEKPWIGGKTMNAINKIPYSGINALTTRLSEFHSPFYMTAKQCKKIGAAWCGHGTPILYWNFIKKQEIKNNELEEKTIAFMRYYLVWNIDQIALPQDFKLPEIPEFIINPIEQAEKYLANFPISYALQDAAFYRSATDEIVLPERTQFKNTAAFYETAFHECAHATGAEKRLNRKKNNTAFEELVAEIASAFVMNSIGFLHESEKNTIAYCQSWIRQLENNPSWIIKASGQADKAYKYIIGDKIEHDDEIAA